MLLHREGWPVWVRFSKKLIQQWQAVAGATSSFLDKVTVSRDDITIAKIDRSHSGHDTAQA
jgi:hypothetical protein